MKVENISIDAFFLSDSQDVAPIKEHFGEKAEEFDSFFVLLEFDANGNATGDYKEVWGMHGIVPLLRKEVFKVL